MKDEFSSNKKLSGNKLCVVMLGLSLVCVFGDEIFITVQGVCGVEGGEEREVRICVSPAVSEGRRYLSYM